MELKEPPPPDGPKMRWTKRLAPTALLGAAVANPIPVFFGVFILGCVGIIGMCAHEAYKQRNDPPGDGGA